MVLPPEIPQSVGKCQDLQRNDPALHYIQLYDKFELDAQTQKQKLQTIDRLAAKVTGVKQPLVENEIKKHRKCIEKGICEKFKYYFKVQSLGRVM